MKEYSFNKEKLEKIRFIKDNTDFFGADQDWFPTLLQRTAGCAPTAAATMYACENESDLFKVTCVNDWIPLMQEWWKFITPGCLGVNRVNTFASGADRFFLKYNLPYRAKSLQLTINRFPFFGETIDFIKNALEKNHPVAFLNLHNGEVKNLSRWHWVVITALKTDGSDALISICDSGKIADIDFALWYKTSKHSGGLVYFDAAGSLI